MKLFKSIKWLFALQAGVLVLLVSASSSGILQLHYPRVVENDPLIRPVLVKEVAGDLITLTDGRHLLVDSRGDQQLHDIVRLSDFRIDIEPLDGSSRVELFAKHRGWLCGTPWTGLIEIPLIADDVPINQRECLGVAQFVELSTAVNPDAAQTRIDFEILAESLPYLAVSAVLYDRPDHFGLRVANPADQVRHFQILAAVTDTKYSKDTLLGLLKHETPRVRTLAAVALFDREDPFVLPALHELCDDHTVTFDGYPELAIETGPYFSGVGLPPLKQTVGDITKKMIALYMERFGYYFESKYHPGFTQYWAARHHRTHCAGWFAIQLSRASYGTSSTPADCVERIRRVRRRIDELSADERAWTLLRLRGEDGSDRLATERELVQACKVLGPDKLLLLMQDKIPSDDPDLQPRKSNYWPYERMSLFVLRHAPELFRLTDSDALLDCESSLRKQKPPAVGTWLAVAAAHLAPKRASTILHDAFARFGGQYESDYRSTLCVAMWQLGGTSEMDFVIDWLYKENPRGGAYPNSRARFIEEVSKSQNGKVIVAQMIDDTRLADLDWLSLQELVRAVNKWCARPIVTEDELDKAWHPLGESHYGWMKEKAEREYPRETSELEAHLADWRKRLIESVAQWRNE